MQRHSKRSVLSVNRKTWRRLVPDRASRGGAKRRASARVEKPDVAMVFPTSKTKPQPRANRCRPIAAR